MTEQALEAHYTAAARGLPAMVKIAERSNGRRTWTSSHEIDGKREARRIAAVFGATPWNF